MPLLIKPILVVLVTGLFLSVSLLIACGGATTPSATQRIAFTSIRDGDFEVYVMNADSSKQSWLTRNQDNEDRPALSPGGSRIAFGGQVT